MSKNIKLNINNKLGPLILLALVAVASASPIVDNLSSQGLSNYYELLPTDNTKTIVEASSEKTSNNQNKDSLDEMEMAKHISLNNPEFRLIGSSQKPVRMRDDMSTKLFVAMENLKKDAGEFWSQFSEKLDKGWTDVSGRLEKSWTDVTKDMDKGLGDVGQSIGKGWNEIKEALEKKIAAATSTKAPEIN